MPYSQFLNRKNRDVSSITSPPTASVRDSVLLGPTRTLPEQTTFLDLFREAASATPDAIAVRFARDAVSYRQLDRRSDELAKRLDAHKADHEFAALLLPNGIDLIVAMVAAMKAGLPFVPLDPEWPAERLNRILGQLDNPVVLSIFAQAGQIVVPHLCQYVPVGASHEEFIEYQGDIVQPEQLIYGFFTSGSTGEPKCALNKHIGLLNRIIAMTDLFGEPDTHVVLQNSKQVFDSSMWQILWPLSGGGTVVVPRKAAILDLQEIIGIIDTHKITMTDFVPSVFNLLVDRVERDPDLQAKLVSLRTLLLGGEEVNARACQRFKAIFPHVQLINTYGPTEASIGSVFHQISGREEVVVPIGRPIANTLATILDDDGKPVPVGMPGEIHIGGICLGAGYLRNPQKTAQSLRKVNHPLMPQQTLYRTGDIGKLDEKGHMVFLGRQDFQVKINGIRIELTEIEGALCKHADIKESRVVAVEPTVGRKVLVAFYSGQQKPPAALRQWMTRCLPKGFMPTQFVHKDQLPRTHNGKIDRKALSAEAIDLFRTEAPVDLLPTRDGVIALARSVLGTPEIGETTNFFEAGGDSLSALGLCMAVEKAYGFRVDPTVIYATPVMGEFVACVLDPAKRDAASGKDADLKQAIADVNATQIPPATLVRGNAASKCILLLGATGFIGAHLLATLLARTRIKVVCLVRAKDDRDAARRIGEALRSFGLSDQGLARNCIAVAGNLEEPGLGLGPDRFDWINAQADMIVNCAARIDFLHGYEQHKTTNALIIPTLMAMCNSGNPKSIQHVSSFAAFETGLLGRKLTDADAAMPITVPGQGYGLSKWVAERLMEKCIEADLPANIVRLGEIGPSRKTGLPNPTAMLNSVLAACLELQIWPKDMAPFDLTSVDCVTAGLVDLILEPALRAKRLHLMEPVPITLSEFADCAQEQGVPVQPVTYLEFVTKVSEAASGTGASPELRRLAALLPAPDPEQERQVVFSDATTSVEVSAASMPSSYAIDDTPNIRKKAIAQYVSVLIARKFGKCDSIQKGLTA